MMLAVLLLLPFCQGYRILGFLPYTASSHQNVFAPVLHALAAKGHSVVFLTPVPPKLTHPNLEVRTIHNYHKDFVEKIDFERLGKAPVHLVSHMISDAFLQIADLVYGQEEAQRIVHGSESFDALIIESYFGQEPVTALMHKFGCVAVEISTLGDCAWVNELAGVPNNPAFQIDFKTTFTDRLPSLADRVYNFYATWSTTLASYYLLLEQQRVMDRYFNYTGWEERPSLVRMVSNRSLILVNYDEVLGYPQPLAPHVKNIGGINLVPNKPLPKDIQKYMDEGTEGVIYFSLGSNLKTCEIASGEFGKAFMEVLKRLPNRVLMKWEADDRSQNLFPKNVRTSKWLPQQDVLAHKNCRLFISHGGFLSLTESAYHGVPILGIPFFGDQPKNMRQVEYAGYGISLHPDNITIASVSWAIDQLLNNPWYKMEAMRRSAMLRDKRHTAQDEAVYWIEHAIKYPNSLTPQSANLTFFQLHQMDLFLVFGVSLLVMLRLFFWLFRRTTAVPKTKVS